jgi:hypothetical protein
MKRYLALYRTTRSVIRAERLCRSHGIVCRIIPVPRSISSECGMSIEYEPSDRERLEKVCREGDIVVDFTEWEGPDRGVSA